MRVIPLEIVENERNWVLLWSYPEVQVVRVMCRSAVFPSHVAVIPHCISLFSCKEAVVWNNTNNLFYCFWSICPLCQVVYGHFIVRGVTGRSQWVFPFWRGKQQCSEWPFQILVVSSELFGKWHVCFNNKWIIPWHVRVRVRFSSNLMSNPFST